MNRESYPVKADVLHMEYDFISMGPKGAIKKAVEFQCVALDIFNLNFGDWDESLQKIDDRARSNNHDYNKLMNTIASVVIEFLTYFPTAHIIARGSTPSRTRLYQMAVKSNRDEISLYIDLFGFFDGKWEPLEMQKNYVALMAKAKPDFLKLLKKDTYGYGTDQKINS